jgi:hypothetical protein
MRRAQIEMVRLGAVPAAAFVTSPPRSKTEVPTSETEVAAISKLKFLPCPSSSLYSKLQLLVATMMPPRQDSMAAHVVRGGRGVLLDLQDDMPVGGDAALARQHESRQCENGRKAATAAEQRSAPACGRSQQVKGTSCFRNATGGGWRRGCAEAGVAGRGRSRGRRAGPGEWHRPQCEAAGR